MVSIFDCLREKPYPGRGILLGKTPNGRPVAAYFIMGRSKNSRNRVFAATEDGIRTRAFDESKLTDPSLVIYHPVRECGGSLIVTNGDQTDTIREHMIRGESFRQALLTRTFEPDGPYWTPRVSGLLADCGSYELSILKSLDGDERCCCRYFFEYDSPIAGQGHFISTYAGGGGPLPSFSGEPVCVAIEDGGARVLAERLWSALDADNRVSLYVKIGGETAIINKNKAEVSE